MKTETISNDYIDGKRVSTQKVTYDKSDDLFTLANIQRQYENICNRIEEAEAGADVSYLTQEKTRLEGELAAQQEIIDNYE